MTNENIKEELREIATLINQNKITTIIELHSLGYNFNKTIEEQSEEVVEKVSQMLLNNLTTDVPTEEVLEEVTSIEEPVGEVSPILLKEEVITEVTEEHQLEDKNERVSAIKESFKIYYGEWVAKNQNKTFTKGVVINKAQDEYKRLKEHANWKITKVYEEITRFPTNKKYNDIFNENMEKLFNEIEHKKMLTDNTIKALHDITINYIDSYTTKIEAKIK